MNATSRQPGFTLTEVLIAMAIFLLGVIFVAALFPAAAVLQKESVTEVRVERAARSINGLLSGRSYQESELLTLIENDGISPDVSGQVHRFKSDNPKSNPPNPNPMLGEWTLRDRTCSATSTAQLGELFWVPVIIKWDAGGSDEAWRIYAFILKGQPRGDYSISNVDSANEDDAALGLPQVIRTQVNAVDKVEIDREVREAFRIDNGSSNNLELRPGDWFLDSNGIVYRVYNADDQWVQVEGFIDQTKPIEYLWYAPPGNTGVSPCKRIIMQKVVTR